MKFHTRSVAAVLLVAALSLSFGPVATAVPRDSRDDFGTRIVQIIHKLQRLIGFQPTEDVPLPPRP